MVNCPKEWSIDAEYKDVDTINASRELKHDAAAQHDLSLLERGKSGIQLTYEDGRHVAAQAGDAKSTLNFYTALLRLWKGHKAPLVEGSLADPDKTIGLEAPATLAAGQGKLLFSTVANDGVPELEACEARVSLY
ncbi:hypothetical protein JCM21900_002262 [Sporobolomyces salmonicolor]